MNFPPPRGTSQGRAGRLSLQPQRSAFQAAWFRVGCRGAAALPVAASLVRERLSRISFRTPFGGAGCDEKASWCGCRLPRARVGDRCLPLPAALPVAARLWWPSAPGEAITPAVASAGPGWPAGRSTGAMRRPWASPAAKTTVAFRDEVGRQVHGRGPGHSWRRQTSRASHPLRHAEARQEPAYRRHGRRGLRLPGDCGRRLRPGQARLLPRPTGHLAAWACH